MGKVKTFLYSRAEYIWWLLVGMSVINAYLSFPKIFLVYYLFLGTFPYFIGKKIRKNRWFYSYYLQFVLGFGFYRSLLFYAFGRSLSDVISTLLTNLLAAIIGATAGLYYFKKHKISKILAFVIMLLVTFVVMYFLETALS